VNCKCINDESRAENRMASYSALWRKLLNYYCKNGGGAGIIYVVNMSLDDYFPNITKVLGIGCSTVKLDFLSTSTVIKNYFR
jgi:hypothetical protein